MVPRGPRLPDRDIQGKRRDTSVNTSGRKASQNNYTIQPPNTHEIQENGSDKMSLLGSFTTCVCILIQSI